MSITNNDKINKFSHVNWPRILIDFTFANRVGD